MKNHKVFIILLLFSLFSLNAQPNPAIPIKDGRISGKIIEDKINEPLPYVNVIAKNSAGKIITGVISDDKGKFLLTKIPEGKVVVSIQFIGFETETRELVIGNGNYNVTLGEIRLKESVAQLDEVTVVAEVTTIQQKVDRKVVRIGKDLTTSGATASEIMNNLPTLSVDQQTGDISMRGNQNVRVMVDGKLSNIPAAQLLKQIPSTSIKQVELITNPSAKYNPEGMSGLINIVLHKNSIEGFNGNFNTSIAYQDNPKFTTSYNMNYRKGKFNFFGSYGLNVNRNRNFGNVDRTQEELFQDFRFFDRQTSNLFKVGVDFYLNDKHTFSVFTNQNLFEGDSSGRTLIEDNTTTPIEYTQEFLNLNENQSHQYNFNYKFDIADGHNLEFEADYNSYNGKRDNDNIFNNDPTGRPNYVENSPTDRQRATFNLDYINALSDKAKLELGLEARLFNTALNYFSDGRSQNEAGEFIPSSTRFDYQRNIYSAYATYGKKAKKWSYQLGLRAETVQVEADAIFTDLSNSTTIPNDFTNDYIGIYPSGFLSYSPKETISYQLSYSRRVDRPGVGQVNPVPEWNTPLVSSIGNEELEPQFTNSVELNSTWQLKDRKGSVTFGGFYRLIEKEINRIILFDRTDPELNRFIISNDNFKNTSAFGLELSTNLRPTKWWSINASGDLYNQTQKSLTESLTVPRDEATLDDIITQEFSVDNVLWSMRMFNNFKLSKKLSVSLFGFYRGESKGVQFNVRPFVFVNTGLRYTTMGGRGTFSLNFNDIFDTMKFAFDGVNPIASEGSFNWESQTIQLGFSYRLGGSKYRTKQRKRRDKDEKNSQGGFF